MASRAELEMIKVLFLCFWWTTTVFFICNYHQLTENNKIIERKMLCIQFEIDSRVDIIKIRLIKLYLHLWEKRSKFFDLFSLCALATRGRASFRLRKFFNFFLLYFSCFMHDQPHHFARAHCVDFSLNFNSNIDNIFPLSLLTIVCNHLTCRNSSCALAFFLHRANHQQLIYRWEIELRKLCLLGIWETFSRYITFIALL